MRDAVGVGALRNRNHRVGFIHSHRIDRQHQWPPSPTLIVVGMLEEHEARISALEAAQGDDRAVLAAINALGMNQREHTTRLTSVETKLTSVETRLTSVETELADFRQEARARFRSVDEHLAEIKDLIINRHG